MADRDLSRYRIMASYILKLEGYVSKLFSCWIMPLGIIRCEFRLLRL